MGKTVFAIALSMGIAASVLCTCCHGKSEPRSVLVLISNHLMLAGQPVEMTCGLAEVTSGTAICHEINAAWESIGVVDLNLSDITADDRRKLLDTCSHHDFENVCRVRIHGVAETIEGRPAVRAFHVAWPADQE